MLDISNFPKQFQKPIKRHRDYMHPDEVRKRERELLPPLKNSPTQGLGRHKTLFPLLRQIMPSLMCNGCF